MSTEMQEAREKQRGHMEVVEKLLAAGAKADLKNKKGETAADKAENESIKEVVENAIKAQNAWKHWQNSMTLFSDFKNRNTLGI